ncbi:GNAT family N-acetyltransferase [Cellulomonas endometrii]|uniref:GNAT family N-acetyltransferase n=1 Tax=Cellulomonas endometrii TaxID=3036301 RepID=UPI0024ACB9C2|nr:GNAT family N-acetyltransferase [Cellulomonas endometrii]
MTVAELPWADPVARALRDAQQVELSARYGDDGTPEPPAAAVVVTLVVAVDGVPAACGSLRDVSGEHGPATGEVKRVYVDPPARGLGLARVLMRELEARAVALGWARLVLEAGLQQPEAIGLYLSLGYEPVERYGEWADVPDSRCFAKALAGAGAGASAGAGADAAGRGSRAVPPPVPGPDVEVVLDPRPGALAAVVARVGGRPAGTASLGRPHGLTEGDPGTTAELLGVDVRDGSRRSEVVAAMVRALEAAAMDAGTRAVVLRTSVAEPGALTLYRALGYRPVLPFGDWEGDPLGLYLGRTLTPPAV